MSKIKIVILIIIIILLVAIGLSLKKDSPQVESIIPVEQREEYLKNSLIIAINDEYKARATYKKVIEKFGEVKPFTNIIKAEEKHIKSLEALFEKYNFDVPQDEWYSQVEVSETLKEMCATGVQAEIANADLYRKILIPATTAYPDVTKVFEKLMSASEDNHLPAFEKCS